MAQEKTASRGIARNMDDLATNGRVLFHSTFDTGFEGWRDHFDGFRPYPPVSLTSYPVVSGRHALLLSTGDDPYDAASGANDASTYKNLSQYRDTGLVSFSGYFAVAGHGGAFAWQTWGIGFDVQKWNNSSRGFFQMRCMDTNAQGVDTELPNWVIRNDTGDWTPVGGSWGATRGITAGENEAKWNFNYIRLTLDLSANGGLGGYYSCQINHREFDLAGLGAGHATEPPQMGSPIDSFSGGLNCGIFVNRRWRTPSLGAAQVVADELLCTIQD